MTDEKVLFLWQRVDYVQQMKPANPQGKEQ